MHRLLAAAAAALVVAAAAPSYAVQTDSFSLTAAGGRTKILVPPGTGAVRDAVVVGNRTAAPITVDLDVLAADRRPDGDFGFGAPGAGFAADVSLATRRVHLAPRQSRPVTVTIHRPGSIRAAEYAVVTAVQDSPGGGDGFSVQERLALLVGVTKDAPAPAGTASLAAASGTGRWVAVGVAAALIVLGGVFWARRRVP